jgi:hypothetical protein
MANLSDRCLLQKYQQLAYIVAGFVMIDSELTFYEKISAGL